MYRDADGARLVGQGARDGLAYPPGRIGRKFVSLLPVKLLDGAEKADIPFRDGVEESEVGRAADILLRDRDHEPQIAPREDVARLIVAFLDALRKLAFLGSREQGVLADLAKINLYGIIAGGLAILDIASGEILVGIVLEDATLEHVDACNGETLVELL